MPSMRSPMPETMLAAARDLAPMLTGLRRAIHAEPELGLHDMAALVPIVTEAGGRFTSLAGVDGPFGGNAVATNGILHDEVLRRIGL